MKAHHCTTLHHHDLEPGVAPVCTTAPPAPPPIEVVSGGGAGFTVSLVETIWLHDGEPTHALIWGASDDGYGIHPPDRWVTKERPSTIQNMTQAGGLNTIQGLPRDDRRGTATRDAAKPDPIFQAGGNTANGRASDRDRCGSAETINRNIAASDRNIAGDAE